MLLILDTACLHQAAPQGAARKLVWSITTVTACSGYPSYSCLCRGGEELDKVEREEYEPMFCQHCDDSLAGHRYVLREDQPYCVRCYEAVFANNCEKCGKVIGIDSKVCGSRTRPKIH